MPVYGLFASIGMTLALAASPVDVPPPAPPPPAAPAPPAGPAQAPAPTPILAAAGAPPPAPNSAADAAAANVLGLGVDEPGRLTVPVTISGSGPFAFTIDTGAERTVISRQLAAQLGLKPGRAVRVTAMTGVSDVTTVIIPNLSVSTAGATKIEAPALDAQHLGASGLLGVDSLKNHAVTIDFDAQQMSLRPMAKRRRPSDAQPGEIVVSAKSLLGQLVVTDAYYRGRRVRVVLDTGSVVSMGNVALRRSVARANGRIQPISLVSAIGGQLSADYTQIGEVRVGDVVFQNLPIAFAGMDAEAAPFKRLGLTDQPAILLGMDALKLFRRVEIDFANRQVRFALPRDLL